VVTFNFDQDSASNPWLDDASGSGMQTVSTSILVTIIDDDVLEGNEQFYIALETRDTSVDLSLMNTTEVTIIDNDGMHKLYRILLYEEPCDLCKRAYIPLPTSYHGGQNMSHDLSHDEGLCTVRVEIIW